ncbi:melanoma-associated antigen B5-like [Mustela nigripes]|uniref:Melanoma-associated antigen B5 n=1 Tax=Mustela putorius furo TaxID=9669 RepID=A0A8U0NZS9_MUSPF|nr:melanoma-associated antigen B5 [Mustela putorius furo]XP_059241274.1 melanoma-associated antigen B5-like [Mustela nigripes]
MPRSQKSKHRTREKRHQSHSNSQIHKGAQAPVAMEEAPTSSSPVLEGNAQNLSATESTSTSQESWGGPSTTITSSDISGTRSDELEDRQDKEHLCFPKVSFSTKSSCIDILTMKVGLLEQFLLYKYKMKQPIVKEDMMNVIGQNYKNQYPEILKRASERIEVVFAVELKEVDSTRHSYDLVSKVKLPNNGRVRAGRGLPKTGLLMTVLGVIFMKGNCAAEEDIWKFLGMMRVFAGRKHFIYGEPRKLITKDLVRLQYLEYRQVLNSEPPRYEFLWGPKAQAETSKMKVLEYLAKVNDTVPNVFSSRYEEALRDEEARARARPTTTASVHYRGTSSSFSHSY